MDVWLPTSARVPGHRGINFSGGLLKTVHASGAPEALGHYSHAIVSGGLVFASGQLPINPQSGQIEGDTIEEQVARVLANLAAVLEAAGSSLDHVLKATLYLSDMSLFARANAAYALAFGEHRPARTAVPVLPMPRGALVEIDVIAELTGAEVEAHG
jgi:2-iminobutanoate/2-iminopropanoate deaminase